MYPCGLVIKGCSAPGPIVVSSHVSQLFHGVAPPAQLRMVPAMLERVLTRRPAFGSNVIVVVPPPAPSS